MNDKTKFEKAYYSLIQFCPDVMRLEAVNVGVVLFCPSLDFLSAKTTSKIGRASQLIATEDIARGSMLSALRGIESRLTVDRDAFENIEDLQRFVATRGNTLRMTEPRSRKVRHPKEELAELYDRLVEEPSAANMAITRTIPGPSFPNVDTTFRRLADEGRAFVNYSTHLPVLGTSFDVPYAYENGSLNLVETKRFRKANAKSVLELAMRGSLVKKHGLEDHKKAKLIVLTAFEDAAKGEFSNHVDKLFKEYKVKHVPENRLDEFMEEVEAEAHT